MTTTTDQARIAGAKACMLALANLVTAAKGFNEAGEKETIQETAEHYYGERYSDAKAFADAIGQLSPYQEGAILALAEYIHSSITTGEPVIGTWQPCAALTEGEYRAKVEKLAADMEEATA